MRERIVKALGAAGLLLGLLGLPPQALAAEAPLELEWEQLMPADYRPQAIFEKYDVADIPEGGERERQLMEELQAAYQSAPVVTELEGKTVKLPGFALPLESDGKRVSEFLLVPYFGACIHVPPPPSNQTVLVVASKGTDAVKELFDVVWVTGEMKIERSENEYGSAGYTIDASKVEPYE